MSNASQRRLRSPSYPSISLEDAVSAIAKIEKVYRTAPVDRGEAVKLLGYSSHSGPAAKILAALASYGLLERAGKGEARVTERAKTILYPGSDEERRKGLIAAALEPPLFRDLRDRFEAAIDDGMIPESGVIRYLDKENFNPSAVRPAARAFLGTMAFLASNGANDSHGVGPSDREESPSAGPEGGSVTYGGARVGDHVQWESQGVLQFTEPQRVRFVTDDGEWVAVEGSETGIQMDQVIVEKHEPAAVPPAATPPTIPLGAGATAAAQTGEREQLEYKLSETTRVILSTIGEIGPKELGRLIRLLTTQRDILVDEEGDKSEKETCR